MLVPESSLSLLLVPAPKPVAEYFAIQRRFRHLSESAIAYIQKRVDEDYHNLLPLAGKKTPPVDSVG